jgi:regulator of protease activity HflC (stomatin/prohibitin superfamily)
VRQIGGYDDGADVRNRGGGFGPPRGSSLRWIILGAIVALLVVVFLSGTARVEAGEACAVTRFGAVTREVGPGLHLRIPGVENFHCFRTATTFYEALDNPEGGSRADYVDTPIDGVTRDGQPVNVTLNLRYRIPRGNVEEIYATIGRTQDQVNERVVKFHARSITRQQVQKYGATELYSGDLDLVSQQMFELVAPRLAEAGVELEFFELKRPRFNEAYEDAIEAQQIAREQIETRQNEAAAAEQEAIRVANLAEGESQAQQIRAAGEAAAIALRGQAARSNPEIISLNYIEALKTINWAILDGGSVTPFLNLQTPGGGAPALPGAPGAAPAESTPAPTEPAASAAGAAPTPAPLPTPPA